MHIVSKVIAWGRSHPVLALVVAVLIGWGLAGLPRGTAVLDEAEPGMQGADVQLFTIVTARVAAGERYYAVFADELPKRNYASASVFNWRLPTLTWLNAMLPSIAWSQTLLIAIGFGMVLAWALVLGQEIPAAATAAIPMLVIAGGTIFMKDSAYLPELWAGLLISASLASWGLKRIGLSLALATAAVLVRELAVPFVVLMAAIAWWESRMKEAAGWVCVAVLFVVAWLWHASQVRPLVSTDAMSSSWLVMGGWTFALSTSQANPMFLLLPAWVVAVIVPLVWAGFWSWHTALGRRLTLIVSAYLGFFMIAGRPENWYWGFLIAPLLGLGVLGYFFRRPESASAN